MAVGKRSTKTYRIEVAPITKAFSPRTISYFSSIRLARGALVKISIRSKTNYALVLSCQDARSVKSEIRKAGFSLKKIGRNDILKAGLPKRTVDALEETARYYATNLGLLCHSLLPRVMLSKPELFLKLNTRNNRERNGHQLILFQMENEERYSQYRATVRERFAHGESVVIVVPTRLDAERLYETISIGIEKFVYLFSFDENDEKAGDTWQRALRESHPILFISTPRGIFLPRKDIKTIIIERENSRAYHTLTKPFLDMRLLIEAITRWNGYELILGDSVLSLETLSRERAVAEEITSHVSESSIIRWRLPAVTARLIDNTSKQGDTGNFEIISKELKEFIEKALREKESIFLFGARKGLAPVSVCGDCGTVLSCANCGAPVVLHLKGRASKRIYICHACGKEHESETLCKYCGSWKLVPLGIGTTEIARRVAEIFPETPVTLLDKEHASTNLRARKISDKFKTDGGILVGTELAMIYAGEVPYSAIVSIDSLFSVPDFHINERIFYLVSRLREMTTRECLIQSRNVGREILNYSAQGLISEFYQNEIKEREAMLYPPFSIFIKITPPKVARLDRIKKIFQEWQPDTLKDSIVMRIMKENWPDEKLLRELALLTPEFSIRVNPTSIL